MKSLISGFFKLIGAALALVLLYFGFQFFSQYQATAEEKFSMENFERPFKIPYEPRFGEMTLQNVKGDPVRVPNPSRFQFSDVLDSDMLEFLENAYNSKYEVDEAYCELGVGEYTIPFNRKRYGEGDWRIFPYKGWEGKDTFNLEDVRRFQEEWFPNQVMLLSYGDIERLWYLEDNFPCRRENCSESENAPMVYTYQQRPKGHTHDEALKTFKSYAHYDLWLPEPSEFRELREQGTVRDPKRQRWLKGPGGLDLEDIGTLILD